MNYPTSLLRTCFYKRIVKKAITSIYSYILVLHTPHDSLQDPYMYLCIVQYIQNTPFIAVYQNSSQLCIDKMQ